MVALGVYNYFSIKSLQWKFVKIGFLNIKNLFLKNEWIKNYYKKQLFAIITR